MNIKTTKKLIISMLLIMVFILLGITNKAEAATKYGVIKEDFDNDSYLAQYIRIKDNLETYSTENGKISNTITSVINKDTIIYILYKKDSNIVKVYLRGEEKNDEVDTKDVYIKENDIANEKIKKGAKILDSKNKNAKTVAILKEEIKLEDELLFENKEGYYDFPLFGYSEKLNISKATYDKLIKEEAKKDADKDADKEPKKDNKLSVDLPNILGTVMDLGKSTLPTLIEQGMKMIDSDTATKLITTFIGGINSLFGGMTESSGNELFKLLSGTNKEQEPAQEQETPTTPQEPAQEPETPTTPQEPAQEPETPTTLQEDPLDEEKVEILSKMLGEEIENGIVVDVYVINLGEEELEAQAFYEEGEVIDLGRISINNNYDIMITKIKEQEYALISIGIKSELNKETNEYKFTLADKLYINKNREIYVKENDKYIKIAEVDKIPEGLTKENEYSVIPVGEEENEFGMALTEEELDKLLEIAVEKDLAQEPTQEPEDEPYDEPYDEPEAEPTNNTNTYEYNTPAKNDEPVSSNTGSQNTNAGALNSSGIEGILNTVLSSDLLDTGLGMIEKFAGTATGLIGGALDKVGEATGATGITGMLKDVVNKAGDLISSGTVRSAAKGGLDVLKKIGGGLTSMFGAK